MNKMRMNGLKLMVAIIGISLLMACKKDKENTTKEELVLSSNAKASWRGYLETNYFPTTGRP